MAIRHRVLVTRHPETQANVGGWLSGQSDVDLTPLGERQMGNAITAITAFAPDRVWSSPLKRCEAIANEVAVRRGCPVEVVPDVAEMGFGEAEHRTLASLAEEGIRWPWEREKDGDSWAPPGGETFGQVYARAERVLGRIRAGEGRTAIVTHGGFSRCLLGVVLGIRYEDIWTFRVGNVSSMLLTCSDTGKLCVEGVGYTPEEVVLRSLTDSIYDQYGAWHEVAGTTGDRGDL